MLFRTNAQKFGCLIEFQCNPPFSDPARLFQRLVQCSRCFANACALPRFSFNESQPPRHSKCRKSHCKVLSMQQQSAFHSADLPSRLITWLIRRTFSPCMCTGLAGLRAFRFVSRSAQFRKDPRSCSARMHDASFSSHGQSRPLNFSLRIWKGAYSPPPQSQVLGTACGLHFGHPSL